MGFRSHLVLALLLAVFTAHTVHASVVVLTENDFDQQTKENVWLVKFYAPWCTHCKKIAPVYEKLPEHASIVGTSVRIAEVDCTRDQSVCERLGVKSYPTFKVVTGGSFYDYSGPRGEDDFAQYVTEGYKQAGTYSERVVGHNDFVIGRQRAAAEQEEAERKSKVVTLTSASFDELVLNSKEPWIIKFYAPWCGHCKRLAPVWHRLSSTTQESGNNVNVAKVDCTVHRRVCSRFGVTGYPSIWYINDGTVYKYQAARKLDTLLDYVNGGWKSAESIGPIPNEGLVSQITDTAVEWSTEHPILAILAGIVAIAIFVAVLVSLLDKCLGDDDMQVWRDTERARLAAAELAKQKKKDD